MLGVVIITLYLCFIAITVSCSLLNCDLIDLFFGIFMGLTFPFRYLYKKVKPWFKKKPKLYSASEIALMSKMGENNELNKLTEEFYLKFQEQYLKDANDLIIIYSGNWENLQYYPLETNIYKLISKEEKNLQQFMDFFRKKGWFICQDIQEPIKKKGKHAMSQEEGLKFTVSLSEFNEE